MKVPRHRIEQGKGVSRWVGGSVAVLNGDSAGVIGKATFGQGVEGDEGVGHASTWNENLRAKDAASAKAPGWECAWHF